MSEAEILKVIADWLEEHTDIAPERVQMDASIADDLLMDSLDQVEIVMALEEHFQVEINDEVAGKWKTVGHIVQFLAACSALAPDPFLRAP